MWSSYNPRFPDNSHDNRELSDKGGVFPKSHVKTTPDKCATVARGGMGIISRTVKPAYDDYYFSVVLVVAFQMTLRYYNNYAVPLSLLDHKHSHG
jgi:hypothetical protein